MVKMVSDRMAMISDVLIVNVFRLLPCLSPLYENHPAVNAVDSALDTLASAVGKHQVVFLNTR